MSTEPPSAGAPTGALPTQAPTGAGQGREGLGPAEKAREQDPLEGPGETLLTALPPEAAHMILCKKVYMA